MNFLGLHSNQIDKDAAYYVMNSLSYIKSQSICYRYIVSTVYQGLLWKRLL